MPEPAMDQGLWERGISALESQLGPSQTLQFMAMVSRQPFDYQRWREERFGKLSIDEVLSQVQAEKGGAVLIFLAWRLAPQKGESRAMNVPSVKRTIAIAVILMVVAAIGFGGWCLYAAMHTSYEAERTLGAYILVADLVCTHIEKSSGQWPRSWDDLLRISHPVGGWNWPADSGEIRKRIRVDFTLTCAEVAKETPESCRPIEQIGPNYGDGGEMSRIVDACKKWNVPPKKPK